MLKKVSNIYVFSTTSYCKVIRDLLPLCNKSRSFKLLDILSHENVGVNAANGKKSAVFRNIRSQVKPYNQLEGRIEIL